MPNPVYRFINVHYFKSLIKFFKEELDIITDKDDLEKLYKENNAKSMLAINSRKVVGHVLVEKRYDFINNRYYLILSLFCIKKEYRKMGIGTSMIKRLERYARKNKISYIEIIPGSVPVERLKFLTFNHFSKKKDNIYYKNLRK